MAHTKVLLREDVDDLGARGEIVRVRAGYARNYLLPRKLAVEATAGNVKGIESERLYCHKELFLSAQAVTSRLAAAS